MIIKCIYDSFVYDVDLNLRIFVDFLRIYVLLHPLFLIITTVILYTAGKIDRAWEHLTHWLLSVFNSLKFEVQLS